MQPRRDQGRALQIVPVFQLYPFVSFVSIRGSKDWVLQTFDFRLTCPPPFSGLLDRSFPIRHAASIGFVLRPVLLIINHAVLLSRTPLPGSSPLSFFLLFFLQSCGLPPGLQLVTKLVPGLLPIRGLRATGLTAHLDSSGTMSQPHRG